MKPLHLRLWWLAALIATALLLVAAWQSPTFCDQVWLVDYGRVLLSGDRSHSMFMMTDGSSFVSAAWLGTALAEMSSLWLGSAGIKVIGAMSMLALCWLLVRFAQQQGVPAPTAHLIGLAVLVDPSIAHSVVVGRIDAISAMVYFAGLCLAGNGWLLWRSNRSGFKRMLAGYALTAASPGVWAVVSMLGLIAVVHWGAVFVRLYRADQLGLCAQLMLAPLASAAVFVAVPWAVYLQQHTGVDYSFQITVADNAWDYLLLVLHFTTLSAPIALLGIVVCVSHLRNRSAWALLLTIAVIVSYHYYPFRVPYLVLACACACMLLKQSGESTRLANAALAIATTLGMLLLIGRAVMAGAVNSPPTALAIERAGIAANERVADFSWDWYFALRERDVTVLRSAFVRDDAKVAQWLSVARPDVIIHATDLSGTYAGVSDPTKLFASAGFCPVLQLTSEGQVLDPKGWRTAEAPSYRLWRLGMFRDHGPYLVWRRCPMP